MSDNLKEKVKCTIPIKVDSYEELFREFDYRDVEERVELVSEKLPAKEIVRRAVYSKIGKLSKSDIVELCPSIGVKSVELALKQLVDEGVLLKKGSGRATFYVRSDSE